MHITFCCSHSLVHRSQTWSRLPALHINTPPSPHCPHHAVGLNSADEERFNALTRDKCQAENERGLQSASQIPPLTLSGLYHLTITQGVLSPLQIEGPGRAKKNFIFSFFLPFFLSLFLFLSSFLSFFLSFFFFLFPPPSLPSLPSLTV